MDTNEDLQTMNKVIVAVQIVLDTIFSESEYRLSITPHRKDGRLDHGRFAHAVNPSFFSVNEEIHDHSSSFPEHLK